MARLFGTDGVRGIAGTELTAEMCFEIGRAAAMVLTSRGKGRPRILIGRDTRISGDMIEAALCAGFCAVGAEALPVGVIPTPALAWLTREYGADASAMISASHNPMAYNGIKLFSGDGYKLPDRLEDQIEAIVRGTQRTIDLPDGAGIGTIRRLEGAASDYISYILTTLDTRLDGIRAAVDCANGAASVTAPEAMRRLGVNLQVIHHELGGLNINDHCGSTHMEDLIALVKQGNVDIGLAFDGDADRLLAVDENGELVDGDQIMAICGSYLKGKGKLKGDTIVATIMSNLGLTQMGQKNDIQILQTKVGDRYVLERMLAEGYNLGGEQSGHVIFREFATTGDGQLTALQLLCLLKRSGTPLSELAQVMSRMPQVMENVEVSAQGKLQFYNNEAIKQGVAQAKDQLGDRGRVLVRVSGTEPLVRVMVEGEDPAEIQTLALSLADLVRRELA